MSLLFSRGSHLSDVPADFRGIPLREWQMAQITEQANSREARAFWKQFEVNERPPIEVDAKTGREKKIMSPKDLYGMKGVPG